MTTEPRPEMLKTFQIEAKVVVRGDVQARNAVEASRLVGEGLREIHKATFARDVELKVSEISTRERRP